MNVVFVLIDGLDASNVVHMSYLAAHKENGVTCGVMDCELPTISKPIYSTLFTGQTPINTNITHNKSTFLSAEMRVQSFFAKMKECNKISAMAAYYWMRELYIGEKYDAAKHRLTLEQGSVIPHALFYDDDNYPDAYVFQDAEALRINYKPDFLLVHSMGVDAAGHAFGANSAEYRNAVRGVDVLLAEYVPAWLDAGNLVIITSDHGMHEDGTHNDILAEVRKVPYWILGTLPPNIKTPQRQTDWYNLLCACYF